MSIFNSDVNDALQRAYTGMSRSLGDIVARLREQSHSGNLGGFGLPGDLAAEAAREIEHLRSELRRLKDEKSPTEQRAMGYADAQRDIRRALGIED